jgi:hypothetical protein
VVREISSVFDHFWNGAWAVPISALVDPPLHRTDLQQARAMLRERIAADNYRYPIDQDVAALKSALGAEIDIESPELAAQVITWMDEGCCRSTATGSCSTRTETCSG